MLVQKKYIDIYLLWLLSGVSICSYQLVSNHYLSNHPPLIACDLPLFVDVLPADAHTPVASLSVILK